MTPYTHEDEEVLYVDKPGTRNALAGGLLGAVLGFLIWVAGLCLAYWGLKT